MSFLFNFELSENDSLVQPQQPTLSAPASHVEKSGENCKYDGQSLKSHLPACEVVSFYDESVISKLEKKVVNLNDHVLEVVDTNKLEQLMSTDEKFQSVVCKSNSLGDIVSHSDLVDGVYEGGLKVWECGIDLAKFLSSHSLSSTIGIQGKNVLEVGCGAGIPGLYCIKCGAACVDFQDYNVEVLKLLTHTNVGMSTNQSQAGTDTVCRYFAGDWEEFSEIGANQNKYDIILSAETIYNVDNYPKLHSVCDRMLTSDGIVLMAAKEYYFGVGGGVESFLEYINGQNCFEHETVWETKTGVPRKIMMLKRRRDKIVSNVDT